MKKIILSIFCVLVIFGCGTGNSTSNNFDNIGGGGSVDTGGSGDNVDTGGSGGDTGNTDDDTGNTGGTNNNETTEPKPEDNETVPSISDGGIIDNITSPNLNLYTISSHIPQTPTDNLPAAVYYSLTASNNNTASMKKYIENSPVAINNDGNRNLIKQQIDFSNIVKEKNIKPIKRNNLSLYKTLPANISLNTKWENIWITDTATMQQSLTSATCIYISNNVYYFLDDRVSISDIDISRISYIEQQFEAAYQKVHEKCGQESDVDGNGKIIFLFTPIGNNVLGFFYTADKYSDTLTSLSGIHSNEADLMYIESNYLLNSTDWESNKAKLTATLIHEFHHMALFDVRTAAGVEPFMDYWINEGISTLTAYYTGYPSIMRDYVLNFFAFETDISLVNLVILVIFIVASFTDYLDGQIARREDMVTTFGKFVDPIADKLLINTIFLLLASNQVINIIIPIIMISRDTIVDAIKMSAASKQVVVAASKLGKLKTVTQIIAICMLLLNNFPFSALNIDVATIFAWIATVVSVISGIDYFMKNREMLMETM